MVDLGSMFGGGVNAGGIAGDIIGALTYIVYFLFLGVILFIVYWFIIRKFILFKYRIFILESRKGNFVLKEDRARIKEKDGKYEFKFFSPKRKRATIDIPLFDYIISNEKNKPALWLEQFGAVDYAIIDVKANLETNKVQLTPIPLTNFNLLIAQQRKIIEKYDTGWIAKYGAMLTVGTMGIIMIILFIVIRKTACGV